MLCQKCGKYAATTHIKTVINGKATEQNLCGYCAANGGYASFGNNTFSNLLASMLGQSTAISNTQISGKCSCCGATFADISKTGKVGCSNCYTEFGEELLPYLKRIHGSLNHVGKTIGPKELIMVENANQVDKLKAKLASLVAAENYEEAARVRDEIKRLEGEK